MIIVVDLDLDLDLEWAGNKMAGRKQNGGPC